MKQLRFYLLLYILSSSYLIIIPYGCRKDETVLTAPVAGFTAEPTTLEVGDTVHFSDQSKNNPTDWYWSFGDGGKSRARNPSHKYVIADTFSVSLTVTNSVGIDNETKSNYIVVYPSTKAPVAAFQADHVTTDTGLVVKFTDLSENYPTIWLWDFGDGDTSSAQHTSHIYNTAGNYTVSLTVTNNVGSNTETKTNYITVHNVDDPTGTVTDYDSNVYNTIKIGYQIWMAENVKTTHYADGTALVDGTDSTDIWNDDSTKYWFVYDDDLANKDTFGLLYTWAAAVHGNTGSSAAPSGIQGICPTGWHVPSDEEWKELEMYIGMNQSEANGWDWRGTDEGGKLKETGTIHWKAPNTGATNVIGFTALPGGYRYKDGTYHYLYDYAYFWLSSGSDLTALNRRLFYGSSTICRGNYYVSNAFSVRCVKD